MMKAQTDCLEASKSQIKLIIRDLEREIGINETVAINRPLVRALMEIERMERS